MMRRIVWAARGQGCETEGGNLSLFQGATRKDWENEWGDEQDEQEGVRMRMRMRRGRRQISKI